jgi:hypothetical protein
LLLGIIGVVSNANPTGGIKAGDNAAFGVQPQGFGANRMEESPARQVLAIPPSNRFEVREAHAANFDPSSSNRKAALES